METLIDVDEIVIRREDGDGFTIVCCAPPWEWVDQAVTLDEAVERAQLHDRGQHGSALRIVLLLQPALPDRADLH